MKIQVANPKHPLTVTSPQLHIYIIVRHRLGSIYDIPQEPNKTTPTIRIDAAEIRGSSSIANVIAPIAIKTKQNITGASPTSHQSILESRVQMITLPILSKPTWSMVGVSKSSEAANSNWVRTILLSSSSHAHQAYPFPREHS